MVFWKKAAPRPQHPQAPITGTMRLTLERRQMHRKEDGLWQELVISLAFTETALAKIKIGGYENLELFATPMPQYMLDVAQKYNQPTGDGMN